MFRAVGLTYGVHNRGGERVILDHIDFEINPGDLLCVVGASGCGKSTLIRMLDGLIEPTEGSVLYEGRNLSFLSDDSLEEIRRGIGWVPQKNALWSTAFPDYGSSTVRDVLSLVPRERGYSQQYITHRIEDTFSTLGLSLSLLDSSPSVLSGGEQKRVAIARALVLEPKVLFLDEPTAGLDSISMRAVGDLIRRVRTLSESQHNSLVVVTHEPYLITTMGGRVGFLHDGHLDLFDSYRSMGGSSNPKADLYYRALIRGLEGEIVDGKN